MADAEQYLDLRLEDVLGERFGRYSKYIIQERALPDARDGLKPVQRRILFAMLQDGNTAEKPFRKAAKTVGNVIGNYHPHGDSSVYEAMVRMSQEWKVRAPLVEMHGNNGSVDGDPPAAMRYTEARLANVSSELLKDIEKQTVEHVTNFDDTQEEPTVLPAKFPNLLINGSTGISSGYATDIPPHQLGEIIDAAVAQLEKPSVSTNELMQYVQGPDFPTGGVIQGKDGIRQAYETGRGKVVVRAKTSIEQVRGGREQILITELPYEVNKSTLVKKMDELRFDRKVDGVAEVRDDTDRTGLRVVIELKKDADAQSVLNFYYKMTDLQVSYNFNMVAINNRTPQLMNLKQLLDAYISHRRSVVTNRSQFDLNKAEQRQHIVEGLIKAISVLDQVIDTIRQSENKKNAKENLVEQFAFTDAQAEAIVNLQLYRLTNTDVTQLEKEAGQLEKEIKRLRGILSSEKKLQQVVKKELQEVKKQYDDTRRTVIEAEIEELKIDREVMIPSEDVIVTATAEGYIKRTSQRSYAASNTEPPGMKEEDALLFFRDMNTTDMLLLFTKKGQFIYLPVHMLSEIRWKDNGQHIGNISPLDLGDALVAVVPVQEFTDKDYFVFITRQGMIKKTAMTAYQASRYGRSMIGVNVKEGDEVLSVYQTNGEQELFLTTHQNYGLRFHEQEVSPVGVRAGGVKAIDLKEEDGVSGAHVTSAYETEDTVMVTQRGGVKRMSLDDIPMTNRAKRGVVLWKEVKSRPHRIIASYILAGDPFVLRARTKNMTVSIDPTKYRRVDRYSNGSYVIDTKKHGVIEAVWKDIPYQ